MKRNSLENLIFWMNDGHEKPIWLSGAPEVGKTYLALDFAKMFYDGYFYLNFKSDALLRKEFEGYLEREPESVSDFLKQYYKLPDDWFSKFIFIFDDFEDLSFYEKLVKLLQKRSQKDSGKALLFISVKDADKSLDSCITKLKLFPLEFDEFLSANNSDWYTEVIRGHFQSEKKVPGIVHEELLNLFQDYLKTGGMPGVVEEYMSTGRFDNIPVLQSKINRLHRMKVAECEEGISTRALQLLDSLPLQLLKANKKFQYTKIRKGLTHNMYQPALQTLTDLNLVHMLNKGDISPKEGKTEEYAINTHPNQFRLFMTDFGLLNAILTASLPTEQLYNEEFKDEINPYGQLLLENYLLQHMKAVNKEVFFWESSSIASIDFVNVTEEGLVPFEVRYLNNNRSKSLSVFKNNVAAPYQIKLSQANFEVNGTTKSIPYYAIFCL